MNGLGTKHRIHLTRYEVSQINRALKLMKSVDEHYNRPETRKSRAFRDRFKKVNDCTDLIKCLDEHEAGYSVR